MRALWDSFRLPGVIEGRELAARKLAEAKLGSDDILARLMSKKLSSLAGGGQK